MSVSSVNSGIPFHEQIATPKEKPPHEVCRERLKGQDESYESIERCIQMEGLRRFIEQNSQGK